MTGDPLRMPVALLAAVYASAIPFAKYDASLYALWAYTDPPTEHLWRVTYELILEQLDCPKLATLQAALLYMQRPCRASARALSDSPRTWSFWGSIVGMASSLGLHLECRLWGIPTWEKRLRRRLWWALYMEDTWRSLLSGRPPFLQPDEWDVAELDEQDFLHDTIGSDPPYTFGSDEQLGRRPIFSALLRLTVLVAEIQTAF